MPPAGFEPTIPASNWPKTHTLDPAATGNNTKIMLPKSSQICLNILQLEPGIQDYRLPWVFSKHKPSLMLGKTWRMTHLTIFMCFPSDIQVLWSSPHLFRLLVLFSVIRSLAVAVVPWMWDLWRSHQNDFVKLIFKMNTEFCSHLCCKSSMIFRHNPLQCMAIPFT
jgi:hypothetical protein